MSTLNLPQIVAKNLIPAEPLELPEAITSVEFQDLSAGHPILDFHEEVMGPLGFTLEATLGPCVAAVAAAAGPSVHLQGGGRRYSSALHMVMIGGNPADTNVLMVSPFEAIKQYQEHAAYGRKYQDFAEEEAQIGRGFAELNQAAQATVDTPTSDRAYLENLLTGRPQSNPSRLTEDQIYARRKELSDQTADLASRKQPLMMVESYAPDLLLKTTDWSLDGGIFHLDSGGQGTAMMLEADPKVRKKLLNTYIHSFDRSILLDDRVLSPPPWLCTMSGIRPEGAVQILHDNGAIMRSFATRCLFLGLPEIHVGKDHAKVVNRLSSKPFDQILLSLVEERKQITPSSDYSMDYHLDEAGEFLMSNFRASLRHTKEPVRTIVAHWPEIACKIALLLHVSEGGTPARKIPSVTTQTAVAWVCQAGSRGLKMCWDAGGLRTHEDLLQEDLLVSVVSKVYQKGPLSRRDLQRSISGMKKADLDPVVALAIERGALVEEDGVLRLKDQAD